MATPNATLRARPYAGPTDLPALLALWPACRPAGWATDFPSPTDLIELLAAPEVSARTQVWEDAAGQVAAYTLVDSYNNLWFDWAPEVTAGAADELVLWGIACACDLAARTGDPASLDTACRAADGERIVLLRRHGFAEELVRTLRYARTLTEPIPEPALPMGYLIRPVAGEAEVEALVALHRAAFGTEHLTTAERLTWMRASDYDPALDLVATHPAHQGRGLARALLCAGLTRLRERGAERALLGTSSDNRAMQAAAQAVGYRIESERIWFSWRGALDRRGSAE